jgi:hypothetical protein
MTSEELCLEACALGDEAIRIAFKANTYALNDRRRWQLSLRMVEINRRLTQITKEIRRESRPVQEHAV